eukprot:764865-Hanusia_phi.AAC.4
MAVVSIEDSDLVLQSQDSEWSKTAEKIITVLGQGAKSFSAEFSNCFFIYKNKFIYSTSTLQSCHATIVVSTIPILLPSTNTGGSM